MTVAQRSSAAAMLSRKGQTVTIVGETSATYDPETGSTTPTAYSKSAKAAILPFDRYQKASNSNIVQGDDQMFLAGLDTAGAVLPQPPVNAVVTLADGTTKKTLIAAEPLNPEGDGNIFYDCIVRGNSA